MWDKLKELVMKGFHWFMKLIEPLHPIWKFLICVSAFFIGLFILQVLIKTLLRIGIIFIVAVGLGYCFYLITKTLNKKV